MPLLLIELLLKLKTWAGDVISDIMGNPILRAIAASLVIAALFFHLGSNHAHDIDAAKLVKASEEAQAEAAKHDQDLQTKIQAAVAANNTEDKALIATQQDSLQQYEAHLQELQRKQVRVPVPIPNPKKGGKPIIIYKTVAQCPVDKELLKALGGRR